MVKIIMHGCNGKMGRVITDLVASEEELEIVAGVDTYTEGTQPYPVFASIEQCDIKADVVVDFSNAGAVDGLLDYCASHRLPIVLCTTGLSLICVEVLPILSHSSLLTETIFPPLHVIPSLLRK